MTRRALRECERGSRRVEDEKRDERKGEEEEEWKEVEPARGGEGR